MDFLSLAMCFVLLSVGAYFSVLSRFFQVFGIKVIIKSVFAKKSGAKKSDGITPLKALATALGGSIGTANIAGVASAIAIGGPGAIFWMWVSGILGMMTKYVEIALAMRTRRRGADGEFIGGAMYYMESGLGALGKPIAAAFALFCIMSAFCGGALVQGNTIALSVITVFDSFGASVSELYVKLAVGALMALLSAFVIFGGARRISDAAGMLVPFAGVLYVAISLLVIARYSSNIGSAFASILSGAFGNFKPVAGGLAGFTLTKAMRVGAARGVFSNEAGVGSAPMAYVGVDTNDRVSQGILGIVEVFTDTILICTMTALAILCSNFYVPYGDVNASGMAIATQAYASILGANASSIFITVSVFLFAFTSIISWSLYGQQCTLYLFGKKGLLPYRTALVLFVAVGSVMNVATVWDLGELSNLLMASCNVAALLSFGGAEAKAVGFLGSLGYNKRITIKRNP